MTPSTPPRRVRGFSLVEMLVSLVLGLVVLLGVIGLYLASRDMFRTHEGLARLQEGGRFALDRLMREARQAGQVPCGTRLDANTLRTVNSPAMDWWADTDAGLVRAWSGSQASTGIADWGTGPGQRLKGTGALLLMRPSDDPGLVQRATGHAIAARRFTLTDVGDLRTNDIILACDGRRSALFQASAVNTQGATLEHKATGRNCTDRLGAVGTGCLNPVDAEFEPASGIVLARWDPSFWFVGMNDQGTRSLYRMALNAGGGSSAVAGSQEIARGVEDLQVEALTRDDQLDGELATAWSPPASFAAGWSQDSQRVVSLRITLTLRSEDAVGAGGKPLERTLVSVATLRNRDR